ncbi:cytochrome c3 family protein [Geomonas sp. Red69]|uniref:cytochrome c3 family protein n=1 Tax=Geomonas diazotrophica TaxID=2843197 RepID=UPI001C119BFD|nr:cytochrome c3 family protein [Geomonas diazotrophica]MBU5637935.1 cytochrome c3 family protein [Geomonas diazotrophica]
MASDFKASGAVKLGRLAGLIGAAALGVCLLGGAAVAEPGDSRIKIVTPPDKSVLEGPLAAVTVRLPTDRPDEIQIFLNRRRVRLPKRQYRQYMTCFDGVELASGKNEIRVVALKGGKPVDESTSTVFLHSELSSDGARVPEGFSGYTFHEQTHERVCLPCHQLDFSKTAESETRAENSPCYQCHKKMLTTYANVHGPAAVGGCLGCHDRGAKPKLSVPKPEGKLCNSCHENSWPSMPFGHGPTAAGSCAICHDPHASNQPYFLLKSAADLCAGCHEEILAKPHVIVGFSNNAHPVRKWPDPYHPGKEFTCVSCHNPHAGLTPAFLQNYDGISPISNFCITCHAMR